MSSITAAAKTIAFCELPSRPFFMPQSKTVPMTPARTADDGKPTIKTKRAMPEIANQKACFLQSPKKIPRSIKYSAIIVTLYPETATICVMPVREKLSLTACGKSPVPPSSKPVKSPDCGDGKSALIFCLNLFLIFKIKLKKFRSSFFSRIFISGFWQR